MIIYPAIDILNGQCVRLYQGDFNRETIYNNDPFLMAKRLVKEGANWLHIIDLDGAKDPSQHQKKVINELIKLNDVNIQIGGGIRNKNQIKELLESGASRVIIGSMAVTNRQTVSNWLTYFGPDKLVLALDVRIDKNNVPKVTCDGWQSTSDYSLDFLIHFYQPFGLKNILCTNIKLDGTLTGPDYSLYDALLNKFPFLNLQASGGIRSIDDIKRLRERNLTGAIIGKALYEKKFTLAEALLC